MIDLDPAWVLHTRDYRETSLLVDVISLRAGRCRVIAKGARRGKRNQRALLQPFRPVLLSAIGHGELRTLTAIEDSGSVVQLEGIALACGLYMNELLLALMPHADSSPGVFAQYGESLASLAENAAAGPGLRAYELALLEHLGLAPEFDRVTASREPVQADCQYKVDQDTIALESEYGAGCIVSGSALLALAQRDFSVERLDQRRLLSHLLQAPLGHRVLRSRDLLKQFRELARQPGLAESGPEPMEPEHAPRD